MSFDCAGPRTPNARKAGRLLAIIGPKKFQEVQRALGGDSVWIPHPRVRADCFACRSRDACIRAWRSRGIRAADISRRLGVSLKTVYRVLERAPSP